MLLVTAGLHPQEEQNNPNTPEEKTETEKPVEADPADKDESAKSLKQHRAGGALLLSMPMGGVSSFGTGFGIALNYHFNLNKTVKSVEWLEFADLPGFTWQTGAEFQYSSYSASFSKNNRDYTSSLTLMVFLTELQLEYPMPTGLTPYGSLMFGGSLTSGQTDSADGSVSVSPSSFDGILAPAAGAAYKITPEVNAYGELRYMLVFESITGSFLQFHAGADYKF